MIEDTLEDNELERYELREQGSYRFGANRREFVQLLGAGVVVAVAVKPTLAQERRRGGPQPRRAEKLSERFHLGEDGTVTVLTSKVEVGQGSRTQITQAVAEELRLPVDRVHLIMADTDQCPDDGGTAGSRTTPSTIPRVRNAAAFLRDRLDESRGEETQRRSRIRHVRRRRVSSSGNVRQRSRWPSSFVRRRARRATRRNQSRAIHGQPVEKWRVLGTSVPKVNGARSRYGTAINTRPTSAAQACSTARFCGLRRTARRLKSIDLAPAEAMEGVTVVRDGDFVGCAARRHGKPRKAVEALDATADVGRTRTHPSSDDLFEHLK